MWRFFKKNVSPRPGTGLRKTKENPSNEEKKALWSARWKQDHYDPGWYMHTFPNYIQKIIDEKIIPENASILDIGCGNGVLASWLAERDYHVHGFDFVESAIEKARKIHPEIPGKLNFICADATKPLPYSEPFQVGIDRGTFHTIPKKNRNEYAHEIGKVIEDGGCLIIVYALKVAWKMCRSDQDDPAAILRDHLSSLFQADFYIEDFREILMQTNRENDIPGFLIILRRKKQI
jgi:SAM-dependent methyltransferase